MATRKRHPKKEIEEAVAYAESKGWVYKKAGGSAHAWGRLLCTRRGRDGHAISIWSTPKNAYNHAAQIYRAIDNCDHADEDN